ncbi:MAG: hypothetical protein M1426_04460 [Patescibacteria group bacterium]|nr:hypothetical protein [Patescibacteria group bacterium]
MIKRVGTILMYIGTIAGLTAAARIPPDYVIFWISTGLLVTGIIIRKLSRKRKDEVLDSKDIQELREYLQNALQEVKALNASSQELTCESLYPKVDKVTGNFLYNFGQGCHSLQTNFGIQGYNAVMGHFALAERYLNRVWSASADGYLEEAIDYLAKAEPELNESLSVIEHLGKNNK